MSLRAAWLGDWAPPWPLGKGRRWGDAAWALAAISQAWVLGGREGRWPVCEWTARRPAGPRPAEPPTASGPLPDPGWIALLRHGSPAADPARRARGETELIAACWEALLAGDGAPWMAAGAVLLGRGSRLQWIAPMGAVDGGGRLHLPPYLDVLLPDGLRELPLGWWEVLLSSLDAEGRLLPAGVPPRTPALHEIGEDLIPLLLPDLPASLGTFRGAEWLHALPGGGWMADPRLRAWARGWGAAPAALAGLQPPGLAMGDPPGPIHAAILQGSLPRKIALSEGWAACLAADLGGKRPGSPPPLSGDPTLDRIRVRWGGDPPGQAPGYPPPGTLAHPCADPFHWMAEGERAFTQDHDPPAALRAFRLAHAHFTRLDSPFWARRAATNAALSALYSADLKGLPAWMKAQGPMPSPERENEAAVLELVQGRWDAALEILRELLEAHPDYHPAWATIAQRGLAIGREDWIREALPHLPAGGLKTLLEASLGELAEAPPPDMDREHALLWELHRRLRGHGPAADFWAAWEACPNHLLRMEEGLVLLEREPAQRAPERLMALQELASRSGSAWHLARIAALWPAPVPAAAALDPEDLLREWAAGQPGPLWIRCTDPPLELSAGPLPPEALRQRAREDGALAPMRAGERIWWGFPLEWEGAPVAVVLLGLESGAPLRPPQGLPLLAPWIARLQRPRPPAPEPRDEGILTDGSEPMATLLREAARVAPTELPVMLLGPTGSGKELLARELHRASGRLGAFVPVNCSAFAEGVLESELFGHVRGAFTGAERDRKGAIESAHGGTLFLDEVADLSPRLQSMFLRVLQEREVRRVGSDRTHQVDVRFLAATHKPIEQLVATGAFRADLWYRLQGSVLRLPSLQERRHEIPFLLPRLAAQIAARAKREPPPISPGLPIALARLPWPGNMREFIHALERALLRCGDGSLAPAHFPELDLPAVESRSWIEATRDFQRRFLLQALQQHGFRVSECAEAIGLARPALYVAARRLGIDLRAEKVPRGEDA